MPERRGGSCGLLMVRCLRRLVRPTASARMVESMANLPVWAYHQQVPGVNIHIPLRLVLNKLSEFGYDERTCFSIHMNLEECLQTRIDLNTKVDFLCQMNRESIYLRIADEHGNQSELGNPIEDS